MTCHCPTRIKARIVACTPATFRVLHFAALLGWSHLEDSRIDPVSDERVDLVLVGYGDRGAVYAGLRGIVPNQVEVTDL